jgi:penicillin-binding protein 1A
VENFRASPDLRPQYLRPKRGRAVHQLSAHSGTAGTRFALRNTASQLAQSVMENLARLGRKAARIRRVAVWLFALSAGGAVVCALLLAAGMLSVLRDLPLGNREEINAQRLLIEAANGEPLGRAGPFGDPVDRKDFPDHLVKAVLSIEDRRFYQHWGVDIRAVVRALHANWRAGEIVQGGSTITQQLAKLQLVGDERSFLRKLREALAALWLEQRLSKSEILSQYLNTVYLGRGAYGMSAAARIYFDKSLPELALAQTALLAGLIQAPSRYDPGRNLAAAHRRAAAVLHAMVDTGAIDWKSAEQAKAQPATFKGSSTTTLAHSWFADWIANHEFPKLAGSQDRVMRIRTTLRPELQELAGRIITEVLKREGPTRGVRQGALVAMRPDGAVVAMVGGRDYDESQFNRAVDAKRQPGSAFKLFVYFAALQNGYWPDAVIDASPIKLGRWEPENYGGQQYGRMTLSQAFAHSVNTAAVRLAITVGLDEVITAARTLGLNAPLSEVPSMALGANEVNLLDLTGCFAAVRAGRPKLEPWGIAAFGAEGRGLRSLGPPAGSGQFLPHQQELTSLLRAVVKHGAGRAAALDDDDAAGKTGTSQDYRDAWFVGFNKALVVGVWVGNDDRSPMKGVTGGSLPAEIWKRFVVAAKPLVDRLGEEATVEAPMNPVPAKQAQCDHAACAAAYQSFRSSDCTYQPYSGSRRLCDKGNPQLAARPDSSNTIRDTKPADRENSSSNRTAKATSHAPGSSGLRGPGAGPSSVAPVAEPRARSFGRAFFEKSDRY